MTTPEPMAQGSDEWRLARAGSLGASQVHGALVKLKTGGWGAERANIAAALVCERLTGLPSPNYVNAAMQHGIDSEALARDSYAHRFGVEVVQTSLYRHPEIAWTHASPDGMIGADGLVEIKAPLTSTHLDTLITGNFPVRYITQCQWQMACTGRQWTDLVSFDNRLPPAMQLFVKRVDRDDALILNLEHEVSAFLAEIDETVATLRARYEAREAA